MQEVCNGVSPVRVRVCLLYLLFENIDIGCHSVAVNRLAYVSRRKKRDDWASDARVISVGQL